MGTGLNGSLARGIEAEKLARCNQCMKATPHVLGSTEKGSISNGKVVEVYSTKTCTVCGTATERYMNTRIKTSAN